MGKEKRAKRCEVCDRDFYPRSDKYDSARCCSLKCRGKLGKRCGDKSRNDKWYSLTPSQQKEALLEAFLKHVDKVGGCWVWRNAGKGKGRLPYGNLCFRQKTYSAHRLSWELFKGEVPESTCVLHTCDNASCVNPEHLFLGSHLDNERDKLKKGRGVGERLNEKLVLEIKKKLVMRVPSTVLAKEYNVSMTTIHSIKHGRTWKDIGEDLEVPKYRAISREDVIDVKKKLAMKIPCAHIAREYGVNRSVISKIKNGKTWRDV